MPLHHAVLALLADKPAHGYELKSRFEQAKAISGAASIKAICTRHERQAATA